MKETKAQLTYVEWVDSSSHPFWQDENSEYELLKCCSIGWKIKDDKTMIALAQSISLYDCAKPWADVIVIPKKCITRTMVIKKVK
jgi:hypothetical protein